MPRNKTLHTTLNTAADKTAPGVCVIGAGNGGMAMAGHLALKGMRVWLYTRCPEKARAVAPEGTIEMTGAVQGTGRLQGVTADLHQALADSQVIMVTTPASAHAWVARELIPCIGDQVVVLNPGRTCGALEVHRILQQAGRDNPVVEAQTFIYASRAEGPGRARIYDIKRTVAVAALPSHRTREVLPLLQQVYPEFQPAADVLETSFANIGAIFHPAPLIMNASKVEQGLEFDYYHEGITPSISQLMERLDEERVQVAAVLGVDAMPAREWLARAYGARGTTLFEAIQNNQAYDGIKAPRTLHHRYITEDVPTGLVPIASFGRLLGVATPFCDSLVRMACGLHDVDYEACGRTVEHLGLAGMNPGQIQTYVATGHHPIRRRVRVAPVGRRTRWVPGAALQESTP